MRRGDGKPSQTDRVLKYMRDFGSITQLEALRDLGVMRLASRISDLKRRGYLIADSWDTAVNRYGETVSFKRYRIERDRRQARTAQGPGEWGGFPAPTYRK